MFKIIVMRKLLFVLSLISGLISYGQQNIGEIETAKSIAEKALTFISNESYEDLNQMLSKEMGKKQSPEKLAQIFSGIKAEYGPIIEGLDFKQKLTAEAIYYEKGIAFEKGNLSLLFSLNENDKIKGLRLVIYSPNFEWQAPDYAIEENILETDITVKGEMPLLGKLTSSASKNLETIIVFVHGSGPNDMDETLGPNKLFKDLSYGLASNNIASIRYNKVSFDYPSTLSKKINAITVEDIVVKDAIKAIKEAKELGAQKVILLGHSLGGYMTPMIAEMEPVDGVIIMAGNASPLHELLIPQYEHLIKNDPSTPIGEFQLNALKVQVNNIQEEKYDSTTSPMLLPLGLPASFWLSLKEYFPIKLAKKQDQPYLILNGDRDYQVPETEAKKWKNGNKNKKSKTIIYPQLNHMFFAGEGVLIPSEYEKEGHLNEQTLKDIINWVNSL